MWGFTTCKFGRIIPFVMVLILVDRGWGRRDNCPEVKPMKTFNIFEVLGGWYVIQYYSSSEEALTYHCMRAEFMLSNGNMDMKMKLTYKYAADPNEETQMGNIIWQIPNPMRPEHWRHTEDHYKGVYNTDVIDTDHTSWMILLHCSDPEEEKKFLSTFLLSRTPYLDPVTTDYLREKVGNYDVNLDYLFPVNQTFCYGEPSPQQNDKEVKIETTKDKNDQEEELASADDGDMYFAQDEPSKDDNNLENVNEGDEDNVNDGGENDGYVNDNPDT